MLGSPPGDQSIPCFLRKKTFTSVTVIRSNNSHFRIGRLFSSVMKIFSQSTSDTFSATVILITALHPYEHIRHKDQSRPGYNELSKAIKTSNAGPLHSQRAWDHNDGSILRTTPTISAIVYLWSTLEYAKQN